MKLTHLLAAGMLAMATVFAFACGGGDDDKDQTPTSSSRTATGSPGAARTGTASGTTTSGTPGADGTAGAGSTSSAGGSTPGAGATQPSSGGTTFTQAQAASLVQSALLAPADVPGGWSPMSDTTQDNAAAAAANPKDAASYERCGRLLGRTLVLQSPDQVTAYVTGDIVSYFSTATVYATDAGAIDCAAENATRFTQPGELARAFGGVFINPDAVVVTPVEFPQVGDGSFAATLSGQISAAGTVVDLTILVVGFRVGNVTGAVGSAAQSAPSTDELRPYVEKVVQRIQDGT